MRAFIVIFYWGLTMNYRLFLCFLWAGSIFSMDSMSKGRCNGSITIDPFKGTIAFERRDGDMFTKITQDQNGCTDIRYCIVGPNVNYDNALPYGQQSAQLKSALNNALNK